MSCKNIFHVYRDAYIPYLILELTVINPVITFEFDTIQAKKYFKSSIGIEK